MIFLVIVRSQLLGECIAMDAQRLGGLSLVAPAFFQDFKNIFLFKLTKRFIEQKTLINQLSNNCFQLFFHGIYSIVTNADNNLIAVY